MESIVQLMLLVILIMVFDSNYDVKALKCYECNEEFLFDPKCNTIAQDQQDYLVNCNSSAIKCLRIINNGNELDVADKSVNSSNDLSEQSKTYIENDTVTSRRCASQDTVNWCLSIDFPLIACDVCDTDGCNGFSIDQVVLS